MNKNEFFKKYKIDESEFNKNCSIKWEDLVDIYNNYTEFKVELQSIAEMMASTMQKVNGAHSVRFRIKEEEHLIEKIIRKNIVNNNFLPTVSDYYHHITDLIGIRILHLYKEDWTSIHKYICDTWEIHEEPFAYVRAGDTDYIENYKSVGLSVKEHKYGYRSVHYLVKTKPTKKEHIIEIQVRTIIEEAWSEIDHKIRYPYYIDNEIINYFLVVFNRMAGTADEMGSYIKFLRDELIKIEESHKELIVTKDKNIARLEEMISELKIEKDEKEKLKGQLKIIDNTTFSAQPEIYNMIKDDKMLKNILEFSKNGIFDTAIRMSPIISNAQSLNSLIIKK